MLENKTRDGLLRKHSNFILCLKFKMKVNIYIIFARNHPLDSIVFVLKTTAQSTRF